MKVLVINGPNINMIGIREKNVYGDLGYTELLDFITDVCQSENVDVRLFQSNHEGAIVDEIQAAYRKYDGIVINPAAYTHTSIAILDALKAVSIPTVEVHLSDISAREDFRKLSYISDICIATFAGFGFEGYKKAILTLKAHIPS